jgi:hypothetical protein
MLIIPAFAVALYLRCSPWLQPCSTAGGVLPQAKLKKTYGGPAARSKSSTTPTSGSWGIVSGLDENFDHYPYKRKCPLFSLFTGFISTGGHTMLPDQYNTLNVSCTILGVPAAGPDGCRLSLRRL